MTSTRITRAGIAYERRGRPGRVPVVLLHAGIADRRMWQSCWEDLTSEHDCTRLDLRGFGESVGRPEGELDAPGDVVATLDELGVERCHLVGASFGAGVAVEVALTRPGLVESLLLVAPGGSLIAEATPDLRSFNEAEESALAGGDLDAAVEANVSWWVAGPGRDVGDVDPVICDEVRRMQQLAFELTADWDDVAERELDPPALDRLGEVLVPTQVLVGALDLDAVHDAARRVVQEIPGAALIEWPGTAHLPSMERPDAFVTLVREWLASLP